MANKVLVVTKDKMEFNLYQPVVDILEQRGIEVVVVAEGLSMDLWLKAGYEIYGGLPKEGDFDQKIKTRTDIDPRAVLHQLKPDVVMTGLADPIHLGESFGLMANQKEIPLGFVEDLWGVHQRSKALPDFVCTLDSYGDRVIVEDEVYGRYLPYVYVTGSPAMDTLKSVKPVPEIEAIVKSSGAKRVIIIGGQGEVTTPMIRGIVELLSVETFERCLVIPRFHPKWMNDPSKASFKDEWVQLLSRIKEPHQVLWTEPSVNTHSLVLSATEVVSVYSNLLIEAIVLGRIAVSWNSEIGKKKMKASLGAEEFPLCQLGAVKEVWGVTDYLDRVPTPGTNEYNRLVTTNQEVVLSDGQNSVRVADAIREYIYI